MDKNKIYIRFFSRKIGFTLTEILVVVIIIGILSTLALPMLVKTLEKARVGEAISNLNLIRTGEKTYFLEYSNFYGPIDTTADNKLSIEWPDSNNAYFDYSVTTGINATDFNAKAQRKANAPTPYNGYYYEIQKEGTITSNGTLI